MLPLPHYLPKKVDDMTKRNLLLNALKAPSENFIVSEESNSLKWINKSELAQMAKNGEISPAMVRMMQKWQSRK